MKRPTKELEKAYEAIVSYRQVTPEQQAEIFDAYKAMLEDADLPRTHTYWSHYYYYRIESLYERQQFIEAMAMADEGVANNPRYSGVWQWRGEVQFKLGHMASAFHSFRNAFRAGVERKYIGPRLLAILLGRKRYLMAAKLGRAILASEAVENPFIAMMAEVELELRNADVALSHLDSFEKRKGSSTDYTRTLRLRAERLRAHQVRHIAIAGMSYVGSTLFGTILGSLEGCSHAGETQEMIYWADPKSYDFRLIDFANDPPDAISQCRRCGADCQVFDRQFRAELVRDPVDFYFRLGRRLGTQTVVSSDKFLSEYQAKDPLSRFDLVVLYKPLKSWVSSHRREEARKASYGVATSPDADDLVLVLDEWARNYHGFLKDLRPQGRLIVINWERFAERPHEHFDRIVKMLGLRGDSTVFGRLQNQHYFGGNDAMEAILKEGVVKFRPARIEKLTAEDAATTDAHEPANRIFRMLESSYYRDFGDLA